MKADHLNCLSVDTGHWYRQSVIHCASLSAACDNQKIGVVSLQRCLERNVLAPRVFGSTILDEAGLAAPTKMRLTVA